MTEYFDYTEDPEGIHRWKHVAVAPDNYHHISGVTTDTIKQGSGILRRVIINRAVLGGTLFLYDALDTLSGDT